MMGNLNNSSREYNSIEKTFTGEPKTLKDEEIIKVLVGKKIDRITFGVETTDVRYKKLVGRSDKLEDVDAVFNNLQKYSFKGDTAVDFMFNYPDQPIDDVKKDIRKVVERYNPTEFDVYSVVYIPHIGLHNKILRGVVPSPASVKEMLTMKEYIYDYLLSKGYHNNISETYSKHKYKTKYQMAHCGKKDTVGIGVASRGNLNDMITVNPVVLDDWMKNIRVGYFSGVFLFT